MILTKKGTIAMTWEELRENLKTMTRRAAGKVSETVDLASLQVKLSLAQKELNEAYEQLGRVAYRHFSEEADRSEKVAIWVAAVDRKRAAVKKLEEEIARLKASAAESREESSEESSEASEA